jgi:hypothetical protein
VPRTRTTAHEQDQPPSAHGPPTALPRANAERNGVADRIEVRYSGVFSTAEGTFGLIMFDPPFRWFAPETSWRRPATTPLDRSRPLWQLWLLPDLPNGRVGMLLRLHHVIADGVAGVALIGGLLDATGGAVAGKTASWTPRPAPSSGTLLADNLRRRGSAVPAAAARVIHPVRTVRAIRRGWPAMREIVFPVVPLMGNIGLGVGVLSYAAQLNFTVVAERASCRGNRHGLV